MDKREAVATFIKAKRMEFEAIKVFIPESFQKDFEDIRGGIVDGFKSVLFESKGYSEEPSESKIKPVNIE